MTRPARLILAVLAAALAAPSAAVAVQGGVGQHNDRVEIATGQGAGGQSTRFWEIRNANHGVDWASTETLRDSLRGSAGSVYSNTLPLARAMTNGACADRAEPLCPLWYNGPGRDGRASNGVYRDNVAEVHNPATPYRDSGSTSENVLVTYNIKIWREPTGASAAARAAAKQPIFEHRIGIDTGPDTDPHSASAAADLADWWRGGTTGRLGYRADAQAGPVTNMGDPDARTGRQACRDRLKTHRNPQQNDGNGVWYLPEGIGNSRFFDTGLYGPSLDWGDRGFCYWEGSQFTERPLDWHNNAGDDIREALYLYWEMPIDGDAQPVLRYILTGRPQTFYAIQIVATDNREHIMGIDDNGTVRGEDTDPGAVTPAANYFRVYQPAMRRTEAATKRSIEPEVSVGLHSPKVTLTRTPSTHRLTTEALLDGQAGVPDAQAVFVRSVNLFHYTNSLDNNGARPGTGPGYSARYVTYDSGPPMEVRASASIGPAVDPKAPPTITQMTNLAVNAQAPHDINALGSETENLFGTQWQRPTMTRPCGIAGPKLTGEWPADPRRCAPRTGTDPAVLRNAWDDIFLARAGWEARWVGASPKGDELGIVDTANPTADTDPRQAQPDPATSDHSGQLLRCADETTRAASGPLGQTGKPIGACANPWQRLLALPHSEQQSAVGYLLVQGDRPGGAAAANVILDTNAHNDRVSAWTIRERSRDRVPAGARGSYTTANTLTGRPELWFCQQGPPTGVRRYRDDELISAAQAGDTLKGGSGDSTRDCRGWAVSWQWDAWAPWSYDPDNLDASACKLLTDPPSGRERGLKLTAWPAGSELYGGHGSYQAPADVPYQGAKPGAEHGNLAPCYHNFAANYTTGTWDYSYQWHVPENSGTYCRWGTRAAAQRALKDALGPQMRSEDGSQTARATRCADTGPAPKQAWNGKYKLGWFYRSDARVQWDRTSCYWGTQDPEDTEVYDPAGGLAAQRLIGDHETGPDAGIGLGVDRFQSAGNAKAPVTLAACTDRIDGYVQTGSWQISTDPAVAPGRGWGINNSGPRLPQGGYQVRFPFDALTPAEAPGIQWQLKAVYEGHREYNWRTNYRENDPTATMRNVQVFAPRGTR